MTRGKDIARIVFRCLAILAAGAFPAFLEWTMGEQWSPALTKDAAMGAVFAVTIGALCWTVLARIARPVLRQPPLRRWTYLISTIVALAALGCFLADIILTVSGVIPSSQFWRLYSHSVKISILITLAFSLSTFFHGVIQVRLNLATEALKERDLAEQRLRQAATEARLSSLESRVQPHFLFNTLNSITALIRENPAQAERMVERLAALLRFSLDSSGARLVPLERELATVRDYLEIEKVRFGDRLRYSIDADPSMLHLELPPMSVQTLVENSVKYAVSTRREGAEILVRARISAGVPSIDVIDDGPGFGTSDPKAGHGLDLLQSRLAMQFGAESGMEIGTEDGRTRVRVLLPQGLPQLV